MPIYEYQCAECGELTEALQKLSDAPLTDCPACGKPALRKKISAAAFRLKGSGWYETDFKSGNKKNLAGDKEAKSDGTGDSKKAAGDSSASKSGDASKSSKKDSSTAKAASSS